MVAVAVTDAELRHALTIIRSVGKEDEVTAFGRARFSTGFFSRFTKHREVFQDYVGLELERFDVAFLVTDEATFFGVKKRLKNALVPGKKGWEKLRNKWETHRLAKKRGVPTPETRLIDSCEDDWEYPVRVKPVLGSGSRGSRRIGSRWEFRKVVPGLLEKYGKLVVQEEVRKRGTVGVELLYNKGKLRAVFQHRRIREYPAEGGPSTMRVSVKYRRTRELAEQLMKGLKWNGVVMVEFGLTSEGPVLFEANPRWWGSLALAVKAGVNFPKLYRDIVVEGDVEPVTEYETGVVCKYLLFGDILHFRWDIAGLLKSLPETTNFDIVSLRDPLPGLTRPLLAMEISLNRKLKERYLVR